MRTTDAKARVSLPRSFANATVLVEQVSDSEVRIRRARVVPEGEILEEERAPLSDRDRDRFLALLERPPAPTAALREAAATYSRKPRRGRK
jgi:uncharacterized protein (DUF1778 family)